MVHIYLDAYGGDNAPKAIVEGAVMALKNNPNLKLTLAGKKQEIEELLLLHAGVSDRIIIDECSEFISNHESPAMAIRQKKDSAIVKGMLKLRENAVDGFVSAGSTGAVLLGGMLRLGRISGIERPALAPIMPSEKSRFLLIDCGANVDCKPEWLKQFAIMGSVYMENVAGIQNPRIGLVNNGAEEEKGNSLSKETYQLLKNSNLNFAGNVEARDITKDVADVIVCDGFVGNVILKFMEGVSSSLLKIIKAELLSNPITKLGALLSKKAFKNVKKRLNSDEVGGAPLLGVNGAVIKAHGSSNAYAISSAINQCVLLVERKVISTINKNINEIKE